MTVLDSFGLDDRVALVTGAASGIGTALAEAMAEAGADVALVDVDADGLEATADRLAAETDASTLPVVADVSVQAETERMVEEAVDGLGGLDVAFANAGISESGGPAPDYDMEAWDEVMGVNLRGTFLTDRAAARAMRDGGGGAIVNTASILGLQGTQFPGLANYTAAKGGVVQLTRQLAGELATHDVRVNAIAPGWIDTPLLGGGDDADDERVPDDDPRRERIPLGRIGTPADLKGIAVYLASDASAYVTGDVVSVDGGLAAV